MSQRYPFLFLLCVTAAAVTVGILVRNLGSWAMDAFTGLWSIVMLTECVRMILKMYWTIRSRSYAPHYDPTHLVCSFCKRTRHEDKDTPAWRRWIGNGLAQWCPRCDQMRRGAGVHVYRHGTLLFAMPEGRAEEYIDFLYETGFPDPLRPLDDVVLAALRERLRTETASLEAALTNRHALYRTHRSLTLLYIRRRLQMIKELDFAIRVRRRNRARSSARHLPEDPQ